MKRLVLLLSVLLLLPAACRSAPAGALAPLPFPEAAITVPFAAGGPADAAAQAVSGALAEALGVPVSIRYLEGGDGAEGAAAVAASKADGSELLLASTGTMALLPARGQTPAPADLLRPVAEIAEIPTVLCVSADSEYAFLSDLMDAMRARPGEIAIGSAPLGGIDHIAAACFCEENGLSPLHIAYDDPRLGMIDLLAGDLPVFCTAYPNAATAALDGRVRILCVFSDLRIPLLPEAPTVSEGGGGTLDFGIRYGLSLPRAADDETAALLGRAVEKALGEERVLQSLSDSLLIPRYRDAAACADLISRDRRLCETGLSALGLAG